MSINRRSFGLLTLLIVFSATLLPFDLAQAESVKAVKAARLYDGTGADPITNAVVVIEGNMIKAVGSADKVAIPEGAEVIDMGDSTLMPGLFDTHGHLRYRYAGGGHHGRVAQATGEHGALGMRMVKNSRTQLLSGVTTMRMTGEVGGLDFDMKHAIESGMVPGPRIIPSGRLISSTGGHGAYEPESQVDGPWDVVKRVRENFSQGAKLIKFSMVDLSPDAAQMTLEEIKAGVQAAKSAGIPTTVHCTGNWGSCIRQSVKAGVDTIEHARPLTPEIIRLLKRNGTSLSLTPLVYIGFRPDASWWEYLDSSVSKPEDWILFMRGKMTSWRVAHPEWENEPRPYADNESGRAKRDYFPAVKQRQQEVFDTYKAGIPIGIGLDTIYGGVTLSMEWMVEAGIPLKEVIHMATGSAAKISKVDDRWGTLEKGKYADLITVKGDPVSDILNLHKIELVIKDGQRVDTLTWN
ncbi:amidohydrolase family protein [Aestuariicella hydrocarbonica]|uniref:Amidohydrolase family protein n=1 Tax=Pseudomaricurvus hydrocarbonicus TaxID=1470433 RepID=A0A9E5MQC6_9GAMM|nr:amidohydrolase family protein [Aestuariicella hydrocarbonica]NHO68559.1 amidohydrolase family protein [Aestuariicella hydrocarbonica]